MFSGYTTSVLIFSGIWVSLALSLNILTGYAGQVSLGHAAFFGIGAYASALLSLRYGFPFWADFLGAILITGLVGVVLGLPSLRVRHDFLVLATMGVNFVVVAVFKYVDFFGGALGLINIPAPSLFGATFRGGAPYLALVWGYASIVLLISWYLSRAWVGLAFHTVRIDEDAAEAVGVSVPRFKIYAFTISAALAGGAGALYGHFLGSLFPDTFAFVESIVILSMVVFGGVGTLRGPVVGAIILKATPELLRFVQDYRFTIYGGLLILMMMFQPSGILGEDSFLWRGLQRLRARRPLHLIREGSG
ncbi:MAG TPA: branched-chain amino acid ABC transporter permease [Anaerolineae bacterium]|nr:branched-chain amino acid ABC transporter permease [Anaerolineae bacterium]HIQ05401.1 branched-chain amino acid ABC transporter permease [Anaerolineae bacterium]